MDFKVKLIYKRMLSATKNDSWKSDATTALKMLIGFKQRFPTRKCVYWVEK